MPSRIYFLKESANRVNHRLNSINGNDGAWEELVIQNPAPDPLKK
jgi:hypothetical protein